MTTPHRNPTDRLLRPPEVAEQLGVSVGYLATRRFEGKGPTFVKLGTSVRYWASDVARWIDENTHNNTDGGNN